MRIRHHARTLWKTTEEVQHRVEQGSGSQASQSSAKIARELTGDAGVIFSSQVRNVLYQRNAAVWRYLRMIQDKRFNSGRSSAKIYTVSSCRFKLGQLQ